MHWGWNLRVSPCHLGRWSTRHYEPRKWYSRVWLSNCQRQPILVSQNRERSISCSLYTSWDLTPCNSNQSIVRLGFALVSSWQSADTFSRKWQVETLLATLRQTLSSGTPWWLAQSFSWPRLSSFTSLPVAKMQSMNSVGHKRAHATVMLFLLVF